MKKCQLFVLKKQVIFLEESNFYYPKSWHLKVWFYFQKKEKVDRVKEILTEGMQQAADLKVALAIDLHTGKNWYEAK